MDRRYTLTLSCPDGTGIVARITTFLAEIDGWIVEAAYHSDPDSGNFFTRQVIKAESLSFDVDELRDRFALIAGYLEAHRWQVTDSAVRKSAVVLVSKEGHCLYELLSQWHSGALGADIVGVIGNHADLGERRGDVRAAVRPHPGADRSGRQGGGLRADPAGGRRPLPRRDRAGPVHAGGTAARCARSGRGG